MGGRFAGEVSSVELAKAASKSSRSNKTTRRDPLVGVDLDDVEHLVMNACGSSSRPETRTRVRTRRSPRVAMTSTVDVREPEIGGRPHVLDLGIATVADPGVHHPPAIVAGKVVGQ